MTEQKELYPSSLPTAATAAPRKRLKPGERRAQILQELAAMLQQPAMERITTAALARRLEVSEAALYRHFASKAQMFEGLLEFIEQTLWGLVQQIVGEEGALGQLDAAEGSARARRIVVVLLQFSEKNPGMVRLMTGDALLNEHQRLQARMNKLFDRIESSMRQCLRPAAGALGSTMPVQDAHRAANVLMCFAQGRMLRYVRSSFQRSPTEQLEASLAMLV